MFARQVGLIAPGLRYLLAGVCLASCGGSSPTQPSGIPEAVVEMQVVDLVNQSRASSGLAPLGEQAALHDVARLHSQAMRDQGFFGHTGADGLDLAGRLAQAGISYSRAAENLAMVTNSNDPARFSHTELMASPVHRQNILDPGFRRVGVGVAHQGSSYWVTEIFIQP